jgi:rhamnosyltransferase
MQPTSERSRKNWRASVEGAVVIRHGSSGRDDISGLPAVTPPQYSDSKPVVPAGIVLYQPDVALLSKLFRTLDQGRRRIFLYVNGPVGPEVDKLIAELENASVVRVGDNQGLGAGMNAVADAADSEGFSHLLLLDQDSTPEKHVPETLLCHFSGLAERGIQLALLAPTLTTPSDENYIPIRYSWSDRAQGIVYFAPTSGSLLSLNAWRVVGPFRADYFIGGIDVEWGFRARAHGFLSSIDASVQMNHRWGTTTSKEDTWRPQILRQSDVRNYFYVRNSIDCLQLRHIPTRWKMKFGTILIAQIALLLVTRGGLRTTRRAMWLAVLDGWRGRFGPLPADLALDQ